MGQILKLRKSKTCPKKMRSIKFPIAPAVTRLSSCCKVNSFFEMK